MNKIDKDKGVDNEGDPGKNDPADAAFNCFFRAYIFDQLMFTEEISGEVCESIAYPRADKRKEIDILAVRSIAEQYDACKRADHIEHGHE